MSVLEQRLELDSMTTLDWIGVQLVLITAVVHLVIGIQFLPGGLAVLFLLAAGGFLGGIVLLLVGYRRRLLYLVGIPYTAIQIVAWLYLNFFLGAGGVGPAEVIDKLAQLALIVVLALLVQWET